jgi:hypothetical protein
MRSVLSIDIDAPPELVFAVVSDPRRWPALLPHYRRVDVVQPKAIAGTPGGRPAGMVARYVAARPLLPPMGLALPVAWTSRYRADPDRLELTFDHVAGATRGMTVRWKIQALGSGSRVTLEHVFSRSLPLSGVFGRDWYPRLIDRLFVRPIAGRTLATFRAMCEALASAREGERGGSPRAGPSAAPAREIEEELRAG